MARTREVSAFRRALIADHMVSLRLLLMWSMVQGLLLTGLALHFRLASSG